jgi:hypothetical protein
MTRDMRFLCPERGHCRPDQKPQVGRKSPLPGRLLLDSLVIRLSGPPRVPRHRGVGGARADRIAAGYVRGVGGAITQRGSDEIKDAFRALAWGHATLTDR